MTEAHRNFSNNVSRLLERRGWTQKELCRRLGMAQTSLTRYLRGDNEPTLGVIERIAKEFKVPISQLFELTYDFEELDGDQMRELVQQELLSHLRQSTRVSEFVSEAESRGYLVDADLLSLLFPGIAKNKKK